MVKQIKKKHGKNRITRFFARHKRKIRRLLIFLFLSAFLIFLYIYSTYYYCSEPTINDKEYSKIKGESYYDKYGIDLNQYLTKEMYSQKIPGNDTLDSWDLYTPVCPHLEPVHYPKEILNPNCEDIGLQFVDFKNNLGRGKPHILHLHSITTQIKNWNEWSKRDDKIVPNYYYKNVENLVDDTYHPFDYGYYDENETILKNEEDTISFYPY
ncbi:hypothetical protein BCR32DRAFT_101676 [Anaeromyces robustus]|uniref:Uncharacterized protein n=1 Tax=Anaeromyces robustus TaxID=1754192 RepID=A0A1Y1XQ34_9FUNG|nr:hypothetical protein BCR32DRAFT_101676 [Anaeromyces robustus]|eukprot:ORX87852.1 hypothetical protein BCR32DRAFT_101676 [Anaeromyces robustus]